ncbi:hypothetical protein CDAR_564981 [Caerostris darwini]|uniref:Uncharacterized protein n=1 Tax=Caerostris darwini TaxID=1538125 RepID=A0AAV4URJ1_9ARAC|nr:hypothetical protein CDAR_564981 [Caerostris darwini]
MAAAFQDTPLVFKKGSKTLAKWCLYQDDSEEGGRVWLRGDPSKPGTPLANPGLKSEGVNGNVFAEDHEETEWAI